jgi:hypothetical protein
VLGASPKEKMSDLDQRLERLIPEAPYVLDDLVLGGDSSQRAAVDQYFDAYAIAAADRASLDRVSAELDRVITKSTGVVTPRAVELHAKQIWNGSERRRSPFAHIESKDGMKHIMRDFATAIASAGVKIVVSVHPWGDAKRPGRNTRIQKWFHIYTALSRLDKNLEASTGKHIGRPKFFLDPESSAVMRQRRKGEDPGGFTEVGSVDIGSPERRTRSSTPE